MELTYDAFISRLFAKATACGTPLSGTFELTPRCTLDCKMCYIHNKATDRDVIQKEKTTEWWLDLAKKTQEAGMLLLLLTGGEPLLRKDFNEIYLACKKMGLLVSVNTNATLINEDRVKFFKENPPQRVNITLYGTSRETYGKLCGVPEAYDRVLWAIKALKEAGINVKINYTVTPYNKDDVFGVSDLADELQLPIQTVTYMFPPLRSCDFGDGLDRTADTSKNVGYGLDRTANKCVDCGNKNPQQPKSYNCCTQHPTLATGSWQLATGEAIRLAPEDAAKAVFDLQKHRLGDAFNKFLEHKEQNKKTTDYFDDCEKEGERISCRAGLTNFWVTWDGKLTPCGMMTEPALEIGEDFETAWNKIRKEREKIYLPPECTNCEYKANCDICAAVSYAETGRFDGLPTYVCEKAKAYAKLVEQAL